jgi:Tfp pilus assembly protein FimT
MRRLKPLRKHAAGATLVEVLVAIAITGIMLPALATALVTSHEGRPTSIQELQADSLLRETTEAVRSVRESGWANVSTNGTYHTVINGSTWTLVSGPQTVDDFTVQVVLSSVERNNTGTIVTSGGTVDPSTVQAVASVAWTTPTAASVTATSYLTRWQQNTNWVQTTQSDFSGGMLTNTELTNTSGGEVQLTDTPASWQIPSIFGSLKLSSGMSANDVALSGNYAYVGYASGLAVVDISNPAAPSLVGTFPTNAAVNSVYISGSDAYLATSDSTSQFMVISIANPAAPTIVGSLQLRDSSYAAATGIFVSGNYAYVVKDQVSQDAGSNYGEFNVIDVSNVTEPQLVGSLNIGSDCSAVQVSGNYAYVTNAASGKQLNVIDVTDKTNPVSDTTVNLGATGTDILINGSTAYVTTESNSSGSEFDEYDISTPTAPTLTGDYKVGATVNGVSVSGNYVQLDTALATKQFMVLNLTTPATPTLTSSMNLGATPNRLTTVGNYSYLAAGDTSKGLTIIYSGLPPTGTFESSTLDTTGNSTTAGFNYFNFTDSIPSGASLKFQVADNTDGTTWNYVGPDGTSATYFTTPASIPFSITNSRYFRYKAYFTPTANGQQTPILDDVTLNYSL